MVAGNFKQLVYSIRQDVDVKILDQAVIQDPSTKPSSSTWPSRT